MTEFNQVWEFLQTHLKPGMEVKNWTILKGYFGDIMTVAEVRRSSITIEAPMGKSFQIVPKEEFKKVWDVWLAYKGGRVERVELRETTRFSKYIISVFHWYDLEASRVAA